MTDERAARAADERLQTILKAVVVGARVQDPASLSPGEDLSAGVGIAYGAGRRGKCSCQLNPVK
jgi:hypothetical protein